MGQRADGEVEELAGGPLGLEHKAGLPLVGGRANLYL